MSHTISRATAVGIGALSVALLGALSRVPYAAAPTRGAVIRLAWRARGEAVRECRRLTADEIARLPAHMRHTEECRNYLAPYGLRVSLDGAAALNESIHAKGARRDRPLYVFRELPVPAGSHRLAVVFALEEHEEAREHVERTEHGTPPLVTLDTTVTLATGQALVVTYDDEQGRFTVLTR